MCAIAASAVAAGGGGQTNVHARTDGWKNLASAYVVERKLHLISDEYRQIRPYRKKERKGRMGKFKSVLKATMGKVYFVFLFLFMLKIFLTAEIVHMLLLARH